MHNLCSGGGLRGVDTTFILYTFFFSSVFFILCCLSDSHMSVGWCVCGGFERDQRA